MKSTIVNNQVQPCLISFNGVIAHLTANTGLNEQYGSCEALNLLTRSSNLLQVISR